MASGENAAHRAKRSMHTAGAYAREAPGAGENAGAWPYASCTPPQTKTCASRMKRRAHRGVAAMRACFLNGAYLAHDEQADNINIAARTLRAANACRHRSSSACAPAAQRVACWRVKKMKGGKQWRGIKLSNDASPSIITARTRVAAAAA